MFKNFKYDFGTAIIYFYKKYLRKNRFIYKYLKYLKKKRYSISLTRTLAEIQPINPRASKKLGNRIRLNLLIPSLNRQDVFGGIATALSFFYALADKMEVDARIIITENCLDKFNCVVDLNEYKIVPCKYDSARKKQVVNYTDRDGGSIPIRENDIFLATHWVTAYLIETVVKWQSERYKIKLHKLIYLIQDFEPGFYPWSSKYLMAESTYRMDLPVIAIFNSKYLMDYMINLKYQFNKSYYFEPILNRILAEYLKKNQNNFIKKRQLIVYGRPSSSRNAFELIVSALKKWCLNQPNIKDWAILSIGEEHERVSLMDNIYLNSVGKLSLEGYACIMSESYAGISLMVSPHPSYPPLEMSSFGIKTITNSYANKDLSTFNENIISINNCTPISIAKELKILTENFDPKNVTYPNIPYINHNDMFDDLIETVASINLV